MTDVKRYHSALITEVGEVCRSRLPQFVRAEDFDRVTSERDQLQRDMDTRDEYVSRLRQALHRWTVDYGDMRCLGDAYAEAREVLENKA